MKAGKRGRVLSLVLIIVLLALSAPAIAWATGPLILANSPVGQQADSPRSFTNAELLPSVLIVGHEAGRRVATARQAIAAGADAVEVDVVAAHGQLYVSHNLLWGSLKPTAMTLNQLWPVDAHARVVEFDVKDRSPAFQRLLLAFVAAHQGPGAPQLFISSRDPVTLRAFQRDAPAVFRFLSIDHMHNLDELRTDPSLRSMLDGISVRYDLVNAETVRWLHRHGILVFV